MQALPKSFDELINNSEIPVLVDFWAPWCGPCKMVGPVIQRIAKEFAGKIITVKINTEEKQNIASKYNISSIPTIMMFFKGKTLIRESGANTYEHYRKMVMDNI